VNLEQALEIVREHIRIGKGMELVNGVPEALEMVVDELIVTQKALELACNDINEDDCPFLYGMVDWDKCATCDADPESGASCWLEHYLQQAKEAANDLPTL
jgi:hypothetical protein